MDSKLISRNSLISNKPAAHLTIIVGLSGLIYGLVFTIPFPLTQFYATIPPVDYTKLTGYSWGGLMAYVLGLGALFCLYLWAIRLTSPDTKLGAKAGRSLAVGSVEDTGSNSTEASPSHRHNGNLPPAVGRRFLFLSSTVLAVISIFSYPLTAIDLFIYAIRTRGWALHGLNPLATAPEKLPTTDPWLGLAGEWIDAPSPYGPIWEWLSLGAFHLSGGDFLPHLLTLKVLAALVYLGCVWLVYNLLQQLQPDWAMAGTLAFAWNPLVLLESVQNGHNDILMTFFLLAAVWAVAQANVTVIGENGVAASAADTGLNPANPTRRFRTASTPQILLALLVCLFLALSILVKFVTVMVVPFFLLVLAMSQVTWGRRFLSIGLSGLLTVLLVIVPMLPLWPGRENWAVLTAGGQAGRSLLALLILSLKDLLGVNFAFDLSRNLILLVLIGIYLYFFWQTLNVTLLKFSTSPAPPLSYSPAFNIMISASFFTLFWYVLLAAPVFHAWYLLWFLPLAPLLLPNRRPLLAAIAFSMTALLIIPYFETIRVWYPALLHNQLLGHLIGVPLLIVPPAVALLWPISPAANSEVR